MRDTLLAALTAIAVFVPKLLLFAVIVVIGWIVAKALSKAVGKILEKVGFDRAVERGGIKKALAKSKYEASGIVGKIVYYFVLLFVLQLAFGVFGNNPISALLTAIIAFLPKLFVALIIIVLASAIAAAVKALIQNTLGGLSYGKALANVAGVFILGLGIIAALNQVGIATTVTTPVLIAVLATVAGVIIVGAGGGLIKPMQNRWEQYLSMAEVEAPKIKEQVAAAPSITEQARQAKEQAGQFYDQTAEQARSAGHGSTSYGNPGEAGWGYTNPGSGSNSGHGNPGYGSPTGQSGPGYGNPGYGNPSGQSGTGYGGPGQGNTGYGTDPNRQP